MEEAKQFLKDIAINIVVVLVAFAYIAYQMIELENVGFQDPFKLIAQALVGIICGVTIKQALGENGFSVGYRSQEWIKEKTGYDKACQDVIQYMEYADNFNQYQEIEKKRNYRRAVLQSVKMKYEMWFDKDGDYIGTKEMVKKLTIWQKIALFKAIKVKVYVRNMFSERSKSAKDDVKKEPTDAKQRTKSGLSNTTSAVLIAAIGVYFAAGLKEWTWASIIVACVQVLLWVLFGFLNMLKNYNFITKIKTQILREKKQDISKFKSGCENHLYEHGPYDEYERPIITNQMS